MEVHPKYVSTTLTEDETRKYSDNYIFVKQIKQIMKNKSEKHSSFFKIACEFNTDDNKQKLDILEKKIRQYLQEIYPHTVPDLKKYMLGLSEWGSYGSLCSTHFREPFLYVECINRLVCPITFQWILKDFNTFNRTSFRKCNAISFGEIHIYADDSMELMGFRNII